jgi:hypothetical protein
MAITAIKTVLKTLTEVLAAHLQGACEVKSYNSILLSICTTTANPAAPQIVGHSDPDAKQAATGDVGGGDR